MIRGTVNTRGEAVVSLHVKGANGLEFDVDAVIDTGFNASLTLPPALVSILGLPTLSAGVSYLADGSICQYDVCPVAVVWDGIEQVVTAYAIGDEPLLGMRLLAGHELRMQLVPGGLVEIKTIP
ncbi:hypothetical protein [Zavarzinella formosa]|uniref:hypothetical protein n=1 Tax=Zavarzinella formosa TaxID=360055 RepID=UPI00035C3CF6|nr:hypothetical protein [Zavarzinella formosa]